MTAQYLAFNKAIAEETNRLFAEDHPLLSAPANEFQAPAEAWVEKPHTSQHMSMNAVAGSGKTTELRRIARILGGARASTIHSLGYKLLAGNVEQRLQVEGAKYRTLVRSYLEENAGLLSGFAGKREATACLLDLLDLARLTLSDPADAEAFKAAGAAWGCECPDGFALATRKILKAGAHQAEKTGLIDFTDMIYLPERWDLHAEPFRWLLCDEVQDFSAAQLALILRHTDEITHGVWVGDPRQSIMGFAFAAYDSYARVQARLNSLELPLSICWRCPPNHLALAREIVPQILPAPGREPGELHEGLDLDAVYDGAERGDLIICRRTAPLIKIAASLIRQGKPARIKGRDFAGSIIAHLKELSQGHNLGREALLRELGRWYNAELLRLENREAPPSSVARLDGRMEMVAACIEAAPEPGDVRAVESWVRSLFDDNGHGSNPIWLSTIHRAKGLEADRVWVLDSDTLGQPFPKQNQDEATQEINLRYVALTRARQAMMLVSNER